MAILVSDTPLLPSRIVCHRNGTPFRNVVHMAIQATHTSPSELLVKLPPGSLDTEVVGGGLEGGWSGGQLTQHAHRKKERERERARKRQTGRRLAYRSLQLQHRRFPRLVLKDALGLGAVLPGVYLFIRGLPLVPVERRVSGRGGVWDGREPILIK